MKIEKTNYSKSNSRCQMFSSNTRTAKIPHLCNQVADVIDGFNVTQGADKLKLYGKFDKIALQLEQAVQEYKNGVDRIISNISASN